MKRSLLAAALAVLALSANAQEEAGQIMRSECVQIAKSGSTTGAIAGTTIGGLAGEALGEALFGNGWGKTSGRDWA